MTIKPTSYTTLDIIWYGPYGIPYGSYVLEPTSVLRLRSFMWFDQTTVRGANKMPKNLALSLIESTLHIPDCWPYICRHKLYFRFIDERLLWLVGRHILLTRVPWIYETIVSKKIIDNLSRDLKRSGKWNRSSFWA